MCIIYTLYTNMKKIKKLLLRPLNQFENLLFVFLTQFGKITAKWRKEVKDSHLLVADNGIHIGFFMLIIVLILVFYIVTIEPIFCDSSPFPVEEGESSSIVKETEPTTGSKRKTNVDSDTEQSDKEKRNTRPKIELVDRTRNPYTNPNPDTNTSLNPIPKPNANPIPKVADVIKDIKPKIKLSDNVIPKDFVYEYNGPSQPGISQEQMNYEYNKFMQQLKNTEDIEFEMARQNSLKQLREENVMRNLDENHGIDPSL